MTESERLETAKRRIHRIAYRTGRSVAEVAAAMLRSPRLSGLWQSDGERLFAAAAREILGGRQTETQTRPDLETR